MPELSKAEIARSSLTIEKVETPEYRTGGYVYCRQFPASMSEELAQVCERIGNDKKLTEGERFALWVVLGACDKRGRRKFTQADIPMLVSKSFTALQRCFNVTIRLNSITDGEAEKNEDGQPGK